MSSSYDFIDLDEEDFTNLSKFHFSPLLTQNSSLNLNETAIFIRSTSPIATTENEENQTVKLPNSTPPDQMEFTINFIGEPEILRFNPRGPNFEGRDSKVFRGTLRKDIPVAIKVYKSENEAIVGAKKEIQIATEILQGRPDFLKFYYSGELAISTDDIVFVSVWEWIEGGTLDRIASKLTLEHVNVFIESISNSIAFLHANNLAHHDIKPQNILVTSTFDRIILIDFGDSKQISFNGGQLSLDEGIGLGTLAYTAPELLSRQCDTYDPLAADVYSYGVLLFYLLNLGKFLPFSSLIPHRAVQLILTVQKGFFAGGFNPESPRDSPFYHLMTSCLQTDPLKRPKFTEILKELITVNAAADAR